MGVFENDIRNQNILFEEEKRKYGKVLYNESAEGKILKEVFNSFNTPTSPILYSNRLKSAKYLSGVGKPQAVFKIIGSRTGKQSMNTLINYISRNLKYQEDIPSLDVYDENGNVIEDLQATVDDWAKDFESQKLTEAQKWKKERKDDLEDKRDKLNYYAEQRKLSQKESKELEDINKQIKGNYFINKKTGKQYSLKVNLGTDIYHLMFSVGGKGHDKKKLYHAMQQLISTQFSTKGMKSVYVLHDDTENAHFHVIVSAKSDITQKNIFFDRQDIFAIKQQFVQELEQVGISRGAISSKDNPLLLSKIVKQTDSLTKRVSTYEAKKNQGSVDVVKFKHKSLAQIDFLTSALSGALNIDKDEKLSRKEILQKKKELNSIKQELLSATDEMEIAVTVKSLEKISSSFNKKLGEADEFSEKSKEEFYSQKRKTQLNTLLGEHSKDINNAIEYFKKIKNKDNKEVVESAIETLKSLHKPMETTKRRGFGRRR